MAGLVVVVGLTGCASEQKLQSTQKGQTQQTQVAETAQEKSARTDKGSTTTAKDSLRKDEAASSAEKRKVMYEANVKMRVKNLKQARKQIDEYIRKKEGYLVDASRNRDGKSVNGQMVYRIPRPSFYPFLGYLEKVAKEIPSQNISGQDVTEEYVDLESRLKAKKAVEKRLLHLMEEAKSTKDLLQVSERLAQVQEEIEQLKGRMNYLDHRTVYATVTIHATQEAPLGSPEETPDTGERMKSSFIQSIGLLKDLFQGSLVTGAALLPPLLVLALFFLPILWLYRRRKRPSGGNGGEEENHSSL